MVAVGEAAPIPVVAATDYLRDGLVSHVEYGDLGAGVRAIESDTLCAQYWRTLQLGAPVLLSEGEMAEVIERFKWYGKPRR